LPLLLYSPQKIVLFYQKNMQYPKHIALIPDGNRTWAKEKGKD